MIETTQPPNATELQGTPEELGKEIYRVLRDEKDEDLKRRIEADARKVMGPNVWMYGAKIVIVVLICLGIGWGILSVLL